MLLLYECEALLSRLRVGDADARARIEGVYVVEGEVVRFRSVEVGITGDNYFEVIDGLNEGETVVSGSYQAIRELRDGSRIKIEQTDKKDRQSREDDSSS